jgi:hypothetical protein
MPTPIPNYDLGLLITLNVSLVLIGFFVGVIAVWMILKQGTHVAEIAERIDLRLRRQYGDIDRELRDIKEMLGGQ